MTITSISREAWLRYLAVWAQALPTDDLEQLGAFACGLLVKHLEDPNTEKSPLAERLRAQIAQFRGCTPTGKPN